MTSATFVPAYPLLDKFVAVCIWLCHFSCCLWNCELENWNLATFVIFSLFSSSDQCAILGLWIFMFIHHLWTIIHSFIFLHQTCYNASNGSFYLASLLSYPEYKKYAPSACSCTVYPRSQSGGGATLVCLRWHTIPAFVIIRVFLKVQSLKEVFGYFNYRLCWDGGNKFGHVCLSICLFVRLLPF